MGRTEPMKFLNLQNFEKHFSLHHISEQRVTGERNQAEILNFKIFDKINIFQSWKYSEVLELKDYAAAG